MCFNIGKTDRIIRVVAGLVLVVFGLISNNLIVTVIGAIPLITGIMGFCPLYSILKIDTGCKKKSL